MYTHIESINQALDSDFFQCIWKKQRASKTENIFPSYYGPLKK